MNKGDYVYSVFEFNDSKDWVQLCHKPIKHKITDVAINKSNETIYGTKHGHFHESVLNYQYFNTYEDAIRAIENIYAFYEKTIGVNIPIYSYITYLSENCNCKFIKLH